MKSRTLLTLIIAVAAWLGTWAYTPAQMDTALNFLYRYMPLPDKAMYDDAFWRANVASSLQARDEMPWGAMVPEREWRHFVLPVRVNNENLDMSRPLFYAELKERVKGMTMEEAILEVNHWCHEKVTYRPSDARTSSPLSSVSQAIGRCGEESTFTVAALRSVGIPARQVYTPRWAHTDDNHAWVEAWANGKWHFLGACEPEPILDLAWFNQPASRGMMMHTNVFGCYDGPEEMMDRNNFYTTINVTENYAPTAVTTVTVTDAEGRPVKDAAVKFMVYNYAEYFPMATKHTDAAGMASLRTGKGDMIVWGAKDDRFGIAQATAGDTLLLRLDLTPQSRRTMEFDITAPAAGAKLPQATPQQRADNNRRLAAEDSIRNAYMATFATPQQAAALAKRLALPADKLTKVLTESRGNHTMIAAWLDSIPVAQRSKALDLLMNISEKDRRDVCRKVLDDNLTFTPAADKALAPLYNEYVLNPRVENEGLTPYKAYFSKLFGKKAKEYRKEPRRWLAALRKHLSERSDNNPKRQRMSPAAVWQQGQADALSASICFVAGLRSIGVPARIDPVTGKTQYADAAGRWQDAEVFGHSAQKPADPPVALFKATEVETPLVAEPRYYNHFSLSQIGNDHFPRQMEYPEGITLQQWLDSKPQLDPGQYMLTTGQRLANGGVLTRSELFVVNKDDRQAAVPVRMRSAAGQLQVIGNLDAETLYNPLGGNEPVSLLSVAGRGYYVIGIIAPNHEPSAHALNDLAAIAGSFGKRSEQVILLFENEEAAGRFHPDNFKLPANVHFGIDKEGKVANQLAGSLNLSTPLSLPLIAIADSFGRVVWVSEGYTIGLGDTLIQLLNQLK